MSEWIEVSAPALGEGAESLVLIGWNVEVGGRVVPGEPLFEVETDKAVFEVEAEVAGILEEIFVQPGEPVAPEAAVARIRVE